MKKLTTEQIEKAVNWWACVVQSPKFDNGDESSTGGTGFVLATMAADNCKPTQSQIDDFKKYLRVALKNAETLPYRVCFAIIIQNHH